MNQPPPAPAPEWVVVFPPGLDPGQLASFERDFPRVRVRESQLVPAGCAYVLEPLNPGRYRFAWGTDES